MINIDIIQNPYTKKELYKKNKVSFKNGVTILVGRNGIGKSTLLHQIKSFCDNNNIKNYSYDNYREGGQNAHSYYAFKEDFTSLANTLFHSEGEQIYYNLGQNISRIGNFIKNNKEEKQLFILLDALDSGLDCEGFVQINNLFKIMQNDFDGELYIILSANNYGLVEGNNCFDVEKCEYINIKCYNDFKNIILAQYKN